MYNTRKATKMEDEIILYVQVPACATCRQRIGEIVLRNALWTRVDIGYPGRFGTPVAVGCAKEGLTALALREELADLKRELEEAGYLVY